MPDLRDFLFSFVFRDDQPMTGGIGIRTIFVAATLRALAKRADIAGQERRLRVLAVVRGETFGRDLTGVVDTNSESTSLSVFRFFHRQ